MTPATRTSKKQIILELARGQGGEIFQAQQIEEIRRQLIVRLGDSGRTSPDYVASVLADAGMRVVTAPRADTAGRHEKEFRDALHFASLDEAERSLRRLDDLRRKFTAEGDRAAVERAYETARTGLRRARMIAGNPRVAADKRAEKREIAQWFTIWLETPDAFFDWLEVRRDSPEFREQFGPAEPAAFEE